MNEMVAERAEIENEVNPVVAAAQSLVVNDATSYTQAMELGKACSAKIKLVEDTLGPAKRKTYEAYQEVMRLMRSFIQPLEAAKKLLSSMAYKWQKAEEDRKRKEAEEARRLADEEAAAKRKVEEDARLALAERLSDAGMEEQAEEMLETPIVVEVEEVAAPAPKIKVQGTSTQENWQGRVFDENLIPRIYMTPNLVKLNKETKALKGETRIPGWEVFDVGTTKFGK